MADVAEVIKSGENCIQVSLQRSAIGLTVNVHAIPRVEDFIRGMGSGETKEIRAFGRHWVPVGKHKEKDLQVYDVLNPPPIISLPKEGFGFRIDRPGQPLTEQGYVDEYRGLSGEILNLSFLRLAGISEADGVSFGVRGVFTLESAEQLCHRIEQAAKKFYTEFLRPYKMIVMVSTVPVTPDL